MNVLLSYLCWLTAKTPTDIHSKIVPNSYRAQLIQSTSAIIWDELPSANLTTLHCVDEACHWCTKKKRAFGGIPFIGVGNFRQIAPVVRGQGPTATLMSSVKSSPLWQQFQTFSLHAPQRSEADSEYTAFVDRIGEDYENSHTSLRILSRINNDDEAASFLFPYDVLQDPFACLHRAFLSPKNEFVDDFNTKILNSLSQPTCKCSQGLPQLPNRDDFTRLLPKCRLHQTKRKCLHTNCWNWLGLPLFLKPQRDPSTCPVVKTRLHLQYHAQLIRWKRLSQKRKSHCPGHKTTVCHRTCHWQPNRYSWWRTLHPPHSFWIRTALHKLDCHTTTSSTTSCIRMHFPWLCGANLGQNSTQLTSTCIRTWPVIYCPLTCTKTRGLQNTTAWRQHRLRN